MKDYIDIPGYDGRYYITFEGEVFRRYKGKTVKITARQKGKTYVVRLTDLKGKRKMFTLSQLMRMTYFKGIKKCLCHRNGLGTDYSVNNLMPISKQDLGKMTGGDSRSKPVCKSKDGPAVDFYRSAHQAAKANYMSYQSRYRQVQWKSKVKICTGRI